MNWSRLFKSLAISLLILVAWSTLGSGLIGIYFVILKYFGEFGIICFCMLLAWAVVTLVIYKVL